MPFGGFGESGMGGYHGHEGFRTFSHYKSIVDKKTWLDLPMRYQPYKRINDKLIHFFLEINMTEGISVYPEVPFLNTSNIIFTF